MVQLDTQVAEEQDVHWRTTFPQEASRFTVHAKQNICTDFPQLNRLWVRSRAIRLWNLDFFSTFYTYPVRTLKMMCQWKVDGMDLVESYRGEICVIHYLMTVSGLM